MKHRKLLLSIVSVILVILICLYSVFFINPFDLKIREEVIESDKIPVSFDGFTIAYFADLHYGNLVTKEFVNKTIDTLNLLDADIVIFGGDLIDNFDDFDFQESDSNFLIDKLNAIKNKYGKYVVLGNHDLYSPIATSTTNLILENSDFTYLTNTSYKIYVNGDDYINLVGIDSLSLGNPLASLAYENVDSSKFTLTISHCPDIFDYIDFDSTDYMLSAHSHGLQIYLPLINRLYRNYGARKYVKGKYTHNGVTMDITNGVGCTYKNARFLSDPEVVFYKLKSTN